MRVRIGRYPLPAVAAAAVTGIALVAGACVGSGRASTGGRLRVVTTVSPITNIVANVSGGEADVRGLVPEGADSHTFEPPPSAAEVLAGADVVFLNGLDLEDPTARLARANRRQGAEIVELGPRAIKPAEEIYDFSFPRSGGKPNPHLWTDPPYAAAYARVVADTLARHDPAHAAAYRTNASRFEARVGQLDAAMRIATATVAPEHRKLLTYHDAFAYFARHYGWQVIGAIQPSSFQEPTPKEVAALIDQIRRERVPAIFGSEVYPSPVLAELGRDTGARYVDTLRDDDLPGRPGDPDHSWFGLMRADFVTMVSALGGDASALRRVPAGNTAPDDARYPQ